MTKDDALKFYLDGILDESRSSEEDAVSPGRHTSLFTAVVSKGVSSVLVKLVGGAEGDGRLPDIPESMPCIHLPPTLILHGAMLGSSCIGVVVQCWGCRAMMWLLCNAVVTVQFFLHCAMLCSTVIVMQCCGVVIVQYCGGQSSAQS